MYSYISLLTIREESKWDSLSHSDLKAFRDRNSEGMDVLCLMKCVLKISFKFLHFAFCIYIKNFRFIPVPIYSFSQSLFHIFIYYSYYQYWVPGYLGYFFRMTLSVSGYCFLNTGLLI